MAGKASLLTHAGRTQSLSAWAREIGLDRAAIRKRLKKGMSVVAALNPVKDTRPGKREPRPAYVRRKISDGLNRRAAALGLGGRKSFVPLYVADIEESIGFASLVYADPLELLCAVEECWRRLEVAT